LTAHVAAKLVKELAGRMCMSQRHASVSVPAA